MKQKLYQQMLEQNQLQEANLDLKKTDFSQMQQMLNNKNQVQILQQQRQ